MDSYTVVLADKPTSNVYVTVSAAGSPQDQRPDANGLSAATVYLCAGAMASCNTDASFYRTVYLDGVPTNLPSQTLVLVFTPSDYNTPQTVTVAAADDTEPQGTITTAISQSVVSADPQYANDIVRNVEVTVHDNLTPGVDIAQLDASGNTDTSTTVIMGTSTTQLTDTFNIEPPSQPQGTVTYVITPSAATLTLSSLDARFSLGAVLGGVQTYRVTFNGTNWVTPVLVTVTAIPTFQRTDPSYTTLNVTVEDTVAGRDTAYDAVTGSLPVLVLSDTAPGVYVAQSGGSTLVSAGPPAISDSYTVRLLAPPAAGDTVTVGVLTDGQTNIATDPSCGTTTASMRGKVCLAPVGHQGTTTLFTGNVTISGNTITLANGSELENFNTDGFAAGQQLVIGGTGTGDDNPCANQSCSNAYVIQGVTANRITLAASLPGAGTFGPYATQGGAAVTLSHVVPDGLFTGPVTYATATDPTSGQPVAVVTRGDGGSWLDNGFLEGELVQFSGVAGTFKVQSIFGADLSEMSLTVASIAGMPASGTLSVTEYALVVTFDDTNSYQPVTVTVSADSSFFISPARADQIVFPKQPHYLDGIQGPLSVIGGTGPDTHDLSNAVILPAEFNTPPFGIAQQPSEAKQIDTLNVYDDGSRADSSGTLSSTSLTGFGMGTGLTFPNGTAFGEPASLPGGITFGDATGTTIEILNVMLGQGNDALNITGTPTPAPDKAADDKLPVGIPSLYGVLTLVQGGGNSLLAVTGSFTVTATSITRTDNVSWSSAGFAVGQQINVPGYPQGTFTITGFTGTAGQTMVVSGNPLTPGSLALGTTISVYDPDSPATGDVRVGGDAITVSCADGASCAGPSSPLVIYGDTSQDGIWYSGDPNEQSGHVFGPKPTTEPVGNDPNFVFPLAQPFQYSGNDVIDASQLDAALSTNPTQPNNGLPSVGLTVYGGPGNDTIIGSQAPDILAGGSGDDTIDGGRGNNLIYGDNGVNVNVLTRVISVVSANGSSLPNADDLFAGHDLINGDGPGSAPDTTAGATSSQDVIIGDMGQVTQDVQGQRFWYQQGNTFVETDTRPQAIQTTGLLEDLATTNPQDGVSDTIDGNLGNDIVFGGGGGDTIAGSDGNDLIFGDFGSVDCVKNPAGTDCMNRPAADGGTIAYVDGSLLPFNVPLNDHTFAWTSIYTQQTSNWGNDLISGGNGNDILIGGAGSDRISGDAGDDDIVGGNDGLPIASMPNSGGAGGYNAGVDFSAGNVSYGDVYGFTGGTQHAPSGGFDDAHSACTTAADCTYGDFLDGGTGNDVIAGDNGNILRTGSTVNPLDRVLTGYDIFNTNSASGAANIAGQTGATQYYAGGPNAAPCAWTDQTPGAEIPASCEADNYMWQADPQGTFARSIQLFDQATGSGGNLPVGTYSDSDIAGGAGNDVLFGQGGNDWVQGDDSVINDAGQVTIDVQTRDTVNDPRSSVEDYAGPASDGNDYIEGNAGNDVLYGDLGQDSIVGGNSDLFGLVTPSQRSDTSDTIYGGSNTQTAINDVGDLGPNGHAHDADTIVGDNGDIYRLVGACGSATKSANACLAGSGPDKQALSFLTFNYDISSYDATEKIIPTAWTLLDYSYGASPTNGLAANDIGGPDLIHGEAGNDVILGETGDDVLFGDGQDDTVIGGNGDDRIYGGNGDDRILGDNGYFNTSLNGLTEPLWDVITPNATDVLISTPGPFTDATTFQVGDIYNEARLFDYDASDVTAAGYADIIYGGLGNDWIHGGGGDDAISGAEALPFYYSNIPQSEIGSAWGLDVTSPLEYDPTTTKFADYNADDPWAKVYDCTDGEKDVGINGTCQSGQKVDFFLNFTPYVLDSAGNPITDGSGNFIKSNDGCDIIYGDTGNDWLVGGTDTNWLFGGFGDDLLQTSQDLEVQNELNRIPEPAEWSDPVFAFGGAGRDVLIADTGKARLYDYTGEFNSFIVPFSPFGAPVVNRSFDPHVRVFEQELAVAGGEDQTFTPNSPLDEIAQTTPADPFFNDQHGGPRDPQPGNTPGVQIDFRGNVDLGMGCPCNPGDAIAVTKLINGTPDPTAPGAVLPVGAPITFTYQVTDPGSVALKITSIRDDNATPANTADDFTPVYVSGDSNGNGLLDPGETWLYTSSGVAKAPTQALTGGHQNTVTVVGFDATDNVQVTAADQVVYTGSLPLLSIGKDINAVTPLHPTVTEQADTATTGPTLEAGAPILFTYRVSTTSTTPLTIVSITDNNGTAGATSDDWSPLPVLMTFQGKQYNIGDTNFDGKLETGEVWLYTSSGAPGATAVADEGLNEDIGTVVATDGTNTLTASNPAFYTGTAGITLVKQINGQDANTTGPSLPVGSQITFTYLVSDTTQAPLRITSLVDDNATPGNPADDFTPALVSGDINHNGLLDPGETWMYQMTETAQVGFHLNTAVVAAMNQAGQTIEASDIAQYTGEGAHVTLHTAVNAAVPTNPTASEDANTPPGAVVAAGASLTYTDLVVNDGFVGLTSVVIGDTTFGFTPKSVLVTVGSVQYNAGDTNHNGILDVGETWQYTSAGAATLTAAVGTKLDTTTVTASPTVGTGNVTSSDPTYYTAFTSGGITVKKAVDAVNPLSPTAVEDANNPASPYYLAAGSTVTFTYLVSSPSNLSVPGTAIKLTDDNGTPNTPADDFNPAPVLQAGTTLNVGDKNGNGILDRGEVWEYSHTATGAAGLNCNQATVTYTAGAVTYGATDPACYYGVSDSITIKKAVNATNPSSPTPVEEGDTTSVEQVLPVGTPITWTYRVTNTGNDGLNAVAVTDSTGSFTPKFVSGDVNGNGVLDPGETWIYTSAGVVTPTALAGQQLTSGSVAATDTHLSATKVTASDPGNYFGFANQLIVDKAVDAANPLAPTAFEDANNPRDRSCSPAPRSPGPISSRTSTTRERCRSTSRACRTTPARAIPTSASGSLRSSTARTASSATRTTTACSIRVRPGSSRRPERCRSGSTRTPSPPRGRRSASPARRRSPRPTSQTCSGRNRASPSRSSRTASRRSRRATR